MILKFGTPEVFLTDNGTEFKNRVIDEYLEEAGIEHTLTPPYHPQANPVERVNRTLKTRIVAFVEGSHNRWDEKLPELTFSLNTSPHASTGHSPALLNFGRELTPPGTLRRRQDQATAEQQQKEREDSWLSRILRLREIQKAAKASSEGQQRRQAEYYNARRRPSPYQVGDMVWKKNRVLSSSAQGVSAKLAPKYVGPYVIVEQMGSNTYKLSDGDGQMEEMVHAEHLKPYVQSEADEEEPSMAEEENIVRDQEDDPQPPRESEEAMSDPPCEREELSADSPSNATSSAQDEPVRGPVRNSDKRGERGVATGSKKRGRPRKSVRVIVRPSSSRAMESSRRRDPTERRRRGRPRGRMR